MHTKLKGITHTAPTSKYWPVYLSLAVFLLCGCAANKKRPERVYQRGWIGGQYRLAHTAAFLSQRDTLNCFPAELGKEFKAGLLVMQAGTNVPAQAAGLRPGDLIVRINGKPIKSLHSFRQEIEHTPANETVQVQTWRDGQLEEHVIAVGTEKYRLQRVIALGLILHDFNFGWDPGFSLGVLGFHADSGHRLELAATDQEFARKCSTQSYEPSQRQWAAWLGIIELSKSKNIISQEPNERKNAL